MQITAEWLKQFCVEEETKFLKPSPYIFTHKDGRRFTVATDGRRMVIVNAMIEGVEERKSPDVTSFVDVERQGVEVSTYLADMMRDVEDETVLVHLTGEKMPVYVFTSAATFALMPMHDYGQSNDYPRFAVTQKVTMSVQCTKERR